MSDLFIHLLPTAFDDAVGSFLFLRIFKTILIKNINKKQRCQKTKVSDLLKQTNKGVRFIYSVTPDCEIKVSEIKGSDLWK